MLKHVSYLGKIGAATAENEPFKLLLHERVCLHVEAGMEDT